MKDIVISIISLLWLIGCQSDSSPIIAEKFGGTFQMKNGQQAELSGSSTESNLTVVVESIIDSRCPEGVNCIRAGDAQVELTLSKESDRQEVDLCIGCSDRPNSVEQDTVSVTVASQLYEVILKDVFPYPTTDNLNAEKEAVLEISLK